MHRQGLLGFFVVQPTKHTQSNSPLYHILPNPLLWGRVKAYSIKKAWSNLVRLKLIPNTFFLINHQSQTSLSLPNFLSLSLSLPPIKTFFARRSDLYFRRRGEKVIKNNL